MYRSPKHRKISPCLLNKSGSSGLPARRFRGLGWYAVTLSLAFCSQTAYASDQGSQFPFVLPERKPFVIPEPTPAAPPANSPSVAPKDVVPEVAVPKASKKARSRKSSAPVAPEGQRAWHARVKPVSG